MPVMISRLVKGSQPDEVRKQRRLCAIYPFNDLAFLLINFRFRTASLRTPVSVSGKRDFAGRDKGAGKAAKIRNGPRQRRRAHAEAR